MLKLDTIFKASVLSLAALALPLAGCSAQTATEPTPSASADHEADEHDHDHDHDGHEHEGAQEVHEQYANIALGTDNGVVLLNDGLSQLAAFDLGGRPTLYTAGDGRHIAAVQGKANRIDLIDGGSWAEPHGDHYHFYAAEPKLSEHPLEGAKPTHVVGNAQTRTTAFFFDDDGKAVVLDAEALEEGHVDEGTVITANAPHHGVAVPLANGDLLLSKKGEEMSDSMDLYSATGELKDNFPCKRMHGEAVYKNTAAFGCEDSILLVKDSKATIIPSPDDSGERVGGIIANHDGTRWLGDWGDDTLVLVNDDKATIIQMPAAYTNRVALPEGGFAVFGTDGILRILDDDGKETKTFEIMGQWDKPKGHGPVMPMIAAGTSQGAQRVWITDPQASRVAMVNLFDDSVAFGDVPGAPSSIAVVNGN